MGNSIDILKKFVDTLCDLRGKQKLEFLREFYYLDIAPYITGRALVTEVLKFQFDTRITSGISQKSLNKKYTEKPDREFNSLSELVTYLRMNNTGSNQIIVNVQNYINNQDEKYREMIFNICIQNLKLGITAKSINKALDKELVFNWQVQGGQPREKLKLKGGEVFALQQKLNGVRATYCQGELIARSGKLHKGFKTIIKQIEDAIGKDYVVDGELIRMNMDNISDNENFRKTLSIVNVDEYIPDKEEIALVIYDVVPFEEFNNNKFTKPYISERIEFIHSFEENLCDNTKIGFLPVDYIGSDINEVEKRLAEYDKRGLEGMMLYKDVPYKKAKHSGLIKIKSFKFSDLKITDWYKGDDKGKWKDQFGGFVVEYKGNTINIGGGYNDKQRQEFLLHADEYIGKIMEVKYKEESKDSKSGLYSLQFPVFQRIREDKTEPSYE